MTTRIINALLLILISVISCSGQTQRSTNEEKDKSPNNERSVKSRVDVYLEGREIKPTVVFFNEGDADRRSVEFEDLKITWSYRFETYKHKLYFAINSKEISFEGKSSLNLPLESGDPFEMAFISEWGKAALYETEVSDLLLVEFFNAYCSGLMCRVDGYLIYDLNTGAENWFSDYYDVSQFRLYDFKGDGKPDFLIGSFIGEDHQGDYGHRYEAFTRQASGKFVVVADSNRNPYFFRRFYADASRRDPYRDYELDSRFEEHWFEPIK